MALHNLKIVVVDGGRSGSYKAKNASSGAKNQKEENYKDTPLYKLLNAKEEIKDKVQSGMTPASVFAMDMGLRVASQLVRQTANYYISDIGRRNGDSNYQSIINRQIEIGTDVLSVVGGTWAGAQMGTAVLPGIGTVIGAAIGAISSSASLGFKYAGREREYQHEMFKENTSQAYNLARANYSAFTGRLR